MNIQEQTKTGWLPRLELPMSLVGLGHCGIHWIAAIFLFLAPYMKEELGVTTAEVAVFWSIFYIASFAANLPSGTLVDMTGKRVFWQVFALGVCALALLGVGFTGVYLLICIFVAVIGATNMLWHPAAISYLSKAFPEQRGFALSIHAMGASLGDLLAPVAAGTLMLFMTWQQTAMVNAVPALMVAALLFFGLKRTDAGKPVEKGMKGRDYFSGMKGLLKHRGIMLLCALAAFRSGAQAGLLFFLPFYLKEDLGMSPVIMGVTLAAMQIGGMVATPVAGHLSDKVGRRPIIIGGLWTSTVVIIALTFIESPFVFVAGVAVLGFFLYAARPVMHSWMMDMAPGNMGGSATSLMFGFQSLLIIPIPVIGGLIADNYGLLPVFYCLAASMLVANVLTLLVPKSEAETV
ncbi:MAG: MFS transporter [Rhodospirillales bacterium]